MDFDRRIGIPIAIMALAVLFTTKWNVELGLAILAVCIVIFLMKISDYYINDARKLQEYAKRTPSGQFDIPSWNEVPENKRQIEWYKNLCYSTYDWKGSRRGLVLNSHISPNIPVINKKSSNLANIMSVSDWRDLAMDEAYEKMAKKTLSEAIKIVQDNGGKINWNTKKKKGKVIVDEED